MLQPQLEAPRLHLERVRDHEGGSRTAWCTDYWRGECPARGWWWRESKKLNKPSKPPGMYKNSAKTGGFPHLLTLKSLKMLFFYLEVLNKINSRDS